MTKQAGQKKWQLDVARGGGAIVGSRSPFLGMLSLLAKFATVLAIALALAVSAYALTAQLWPDVTSRIPLFGVDPEANLLAGAVFFWLELFAVVGGIRLYDRLVQRDETHRRLRRLETTLNQLDESLYLKRIAFATSLDEGKRPDGTYAVDMIDLNLSIARLRHDFLVKQLLDPRLTDHSRIVIDRVLRALDYMVEQTSRIGLGARASNMASSTPTGSDESPTSEPLPAISLPDLEDQLEELISVTDPENAGLADTMDQLRAANKTLLPSKTQKEKRTGAVR